ncbi:MAG: endonuclease/exonuclease/phosphatase family protein [Treponema sp.]|nr:endonuclease/exonuclease/phosphatase family protein [Treponema sp.]MCL2250539.1 endonuclease/exonuclease/phosphatase family protein [Treponema sp.]
MKNQKFWFVFFMGFLLTGCAACVINEEAGESSGSQTKFAESLRLMTWNVHNLFDGEDNGNEYDEFLQSSGWSAEKYLGRLNTISDAIGRIDPLPDIIMLMELESLRTIEDIAHSMKSGYSWSHFASNPGSAIGLGVMSRYPLTEIKTHSISIDDDTTPRPVLEARVEIDTENFVLFVCHWKSKIGGDAATENIRRASARVILRRVRELQKEKPDLGIIIAGDLNLNYDEFYRQNASMICALLPDDPYCAQLSSGIQKDFLVISKNKPPLPVHFPNDSIVFYSPWMNELENGSYFYKNDWETIDHFLISNHFFNNKGFEYEKTVIVNSAPFANASGVPVAYNTRSGLGLSDHLPLLLTLKFIN